MKARIGRFLAACLEAWDAVRPPTESEAAWDDYDAFLAANAEARRGQLRREAAHNEPGLALDERASVPMREQGGPV
jgi:hypothetical protein